MNLRIILLSLLISIASLGYAQKDIADNDISEAIENEISYDPAINLNNINITVNQGIVELTGQVSNILTKDRAANIAEMVKGVSTVSNRIEVTPKKTLKDSDIRSNIMASLLENPTTESYEVNVDVKQNHVTLTGTVDSYREKRLCSTVAKSVPGVKSLENNIEVTYDIVRRDAEIENDISQALKWSKLVDDALIEVEVEDGVVNLDGSVATVSDKNHAHFLALTSGVKRVNMEDLDIEWWVPNDELVRDKSEYASETDVENAIADAAFMDPRLESFDLMIDYEDGVVTLRGKVDNLEAKQAAKNIAMNTMAVKRVNNRIKVDTEFPPDDEKIRKNILEALARNSITESYEIVVSVSAGIVNLTGFVDSYLEKMTASAVAGKVDGITTVKNNLTVDEELSYYWWEGIPFYTWYYVPDINARVIAGSMIDDDQIKEDVKNELWWSPYVDSKDIQVEVDNGEVTLTGTASTLREYNRATQNAYEGGAWDVDNDILIK